ncbi:MAG TPA: glycosyltransferase [Anaerolineales bacterium]|nr:glycosyltransferase [Anaerolineales bacterium]
MPSLVNDKPNITFLFSDTGGGHRAAAEAIIESLYNEFGDTLATEMVDFLKDYAPPPFNLLPEIYPDLVRAPDLWGAMFDISDGRPQARIIHSTFWPYVRRASHRLVRDHKSDMLVCVHPVANSFVLKALGEHRPPYVTVVTDLVSTHALWFDKRADMIVVPTELARQNAIHYGMAPERIRLVGQPVSLRCSAPTGDKALLRSQLGWPQGKFTVLIVGGGDGMGPLAETARAIDESGLDLVLVIVAGRNSKLEAELREMNWENPVLIYGFTRDMPDFMRAADVIVTKAGPGTIAEALNAELPIILYSKLPGQEDGNVDFVVSENVGVWAPESQTVIRTLTRWYCRLDERQKVIAACRRAARPDASRQIARIIGAQIGLTDQPLEVTSF